MIKRNKRNPQNNSRPIWKGKLPLKPLSILVICPTKCNKSLKKYKTHLKVRKQQSKAKAG